MEGEKTAAGGGAENVTVFLGKEERSTKRQIMLG